MTPSEVYDFNLLEHRFAHSQLGQRLDGKIRFERFKPEHISNNQWIKLFGLDVDNLRHMHLTRRLTEEFIKANKEPFFRYQCPVEFDIRDENLLLAAATIHDWGEAFVGDATYSHKVGQSNIRETVALDYIIDWLARDDAERERLFLAAEIAMNPDTYLGQTFNTIERLGYLRTGLRAAELATRFKTDDPVLSDHFTWMASNIAGHQISTLTRRSWEYPAVAKYLASQADNISTLFDHVTHDTFTLYPDEEQKKRWDEFYTARRIWQEESVFAGGYTTR